MPKLKRRDVVLIPMLAAGAYAGGHFSQRLAAPTKLNVPGTIGAIEIHDAVLTSLRRTVSPEVEKGQLGEFIALAKRKFDWVFHPLTSIEVFDRKLCTEFLVNSNLIGNGYEFPAYEFVEYSGACNPFR
jgi:hypothetical protein